MSDLGITSIRRVIRVRPLSILFWLGFTPLAVYGYNAFRLDAYNQGVICAHAEQEAYDESKQAHGTPLNTLSQCYEPDGVLTYMGIGPLP